jgi:hypothetical protein
MNKSLRAAIGAGTALVGLALAGSALASFAPRLVASNLGTSTRLGVVVGENDAPTAKVQIYVPSGYQIATPAVGTKLGSVTAVASAVDLGGAHLPLTGEVDAIASNPALQAQCGTTDAAQTWDLHVSAAGQTLDIPLYVVPTAGPETAIGPAKLVVCLPPPDVPVGTPGRSTFGAKLLSATFDVSAITEPTATGDYRWTSLWTPYNPGVGTANAAGSVETQSLRHIPTTLKLTVKKTRIVTVKKARVKGKLRKVTTVRTRVTFLSTATDNGKAPASVSVTTTAGGKRVGGATGSFVLTAGKKATVVATASVDGQTSVPSGTPTSATDLFYADLGSNGCVPSAIFGGLPCSDATTGGTVVKATTTVTAFKK